MPGAAALMYRDLKENPLGTVTGDVDLGMPTNYKIPPARIYVRNWSRTRPWKRLLQAVSYRRGAEDLLSKNKDLRNVYSADAIYRRIIEQAQDFSEYSKPEIKPVVFLVRVPGRPDHLGGSYMSRDVKVPPAIDADSEPIMVEVPEGTLDNYVGNYLRMHGFANAEQFDKNSKDPEKFIPNPSVIGQEKARLATYWSRRRNPVFRFTDSGVSEEHDNQYGVLEFIRVPVGPVQEVVDKEYLQAIDLAEAL